MSTCFLSYTVKPVSINVSQALASFDKKKFFEDSLSGGDCAASFVLTC
jgi:hypothetical protein